MNDPSTIADVWPGELVSIFDRHYKKLGWFGFRFGIRYYATVSLDDGEETLWSAGIPALRLREGSP
jgi:hypothetical protein